jgi:hypothetical protein
MAGLITSQKQFRDALIAKNEYAQGDEYSVGHPNALSTGDDQGKGETNTIGSATDIAKRNALLAKNKYSRSKEYGVSDTL